MRLRCGLGLFILTISDEWYHGGDSFAEGVAFVHIGLYIRAVEPARPR